MKQNNIKTYALVGGILLIALIVIFLVNSQSTNPAPLLNQDTNANLAASSTTTLQATSTVKKITTKTMTTNTSGLIKVPNPTKISYADYEGILSAAKKQCSDFSAVMFNQKYYGLYANVSFQPYLNAVSSTCYMKITGTQQNLLTASSSAVLIFRDVYADKVNLSCTNPLLNDSNSADWTCVDKITGKEIGRQAFDDLVSKYMTQ
jgi:hypothetical protein